MEKRKTMIMLKRPRGTRDFPPEEMEKRRAVEQKFREIAEKWGYREIATPTFEALELFTLKSGEEIVKEIYAFKDKAGRDLALRPELTAPSIRFYVNELQMAPKPLKLYYFQNCFRYEEPQKGRFREFWQFGVELIGADTPEADAEVIALAMQMLKAVGVEAELHIGSLDILRMLMREIESEKQDKILDYIDKKDREGLQVYLNQFRISTKELMGLIALHGDKSETLLKLRNITGESEEYKRFIEVLKFLDMYGVSYEVDLSIARGLDYYTGVVFEAYARELGAQNQILGGGSYRLAHLFGGVNTPATGFGIGFDRVMEALGDAIEVKKPKRIAVIAAGDIVRDEALEIALQLREYATVDLDLMHRSLKHQLAHANAIGADYALFIGGDELKSGKLTLRNMHSGEQLSLSLEEIIRRIKNGS
ncbi:MAG: histidine--tRNA ligase [Methanocellales archaeon]